MLLRSEAGSAAHQRNQCRPCRQPRQDLASLQIRAGCLLGGKKFELQAVSGTLVHTVQAEMTFRLPPGNSADGIIAALATQQATITVVAMFRILDEPQHRPAGHDPEQSSQRAKRPAPEPRDAKIQRHNKEENQPEPNPLPEIGLFETEQQLIPG